MPLRVLVVEPDRHAREGLKAMLSAAGAEVSAAADIASGFACVASLAYDLLLLDADAPLGRMLPLGVPDLLRVARLVNPEVRGLLVASCPDDLPRHWEAETGATVLEKPVDVARLRVELGRAAQGRPLAAGEPLGCVCQGSGGSPGR